MPARRPRRERRAGLTLVETALLVCLVGVLLAVFVPTFVAHLRTSKIAEAAEQLETLHLSTVAYYGARHRADGDRTRTRCLPGEAGPAPAEPATEPVSLDFASERTAGAATWRALGFQPVEPVRYRYTFVPAAAGCDLTAEVSATLVTLRAEGDLDGDGDMSTFERRAGLDQDGELVAVGILHVQDRTE